MPTTTSGLICPCGLDATECICTCGQCVTLRASAATDERATCSRCSRDLPVSAFSVRRTGQRQSWCRECAREYARERRTNGTTLASGTRRTRAEVNAFDRPFGLEIEVIHGDMLAVRDAFRALGLECEAEGYNHTTRRYWKIVPDGSVARGFEVVSPVLRGAEGRREARAAFKALRDAGATVDRSCGLHVHHDASDLTGADLARLVRTWRDEQGLIDGLLAPSRRTNGVSGNSWAAPLDAYDVEAAERLARDLPGRMSRREAARYLGDPRSHMRYRSLNFRVFSLHGTVEVRQHQGTVNATKALAWVMFGQAYIARCKREDVTTYTALSEVLRECEALGMESQTVAYLEDRALAFAGEQIAA